MRHVNGRVLRLAMAPAMLMVGGVLGAVAGAGERDAKEAARMGDEGKSGVGRIVWTDLTVENASSVRDFYRDVVGWEPDAVSMGEYDDFNMNAPGTEDAVAGICHARGANAKLPPQWLIYITVEDVDESAKRAAALGGKVIDGPRGMGKSRFCVIQDPAGAVAALVSG